MFFLIGSFGCGPKQTSNCQFDINFDDLNVKSIQYSSHNQNSRGSEFAKLCLAASGLLDQEQSTPKDTANLNDSQNDSLFLSNHSIEETVDGSQCKSCLSHSMEYANSLASDLTNVTPMRLSQLSDVFTCDEGKSLLFSETTAFCMVVCVSSKFPTFHMETRSLKLLRSLFLHFLRSWCFSDKDHGVQPF